jgi:FkbM family methyltransferase
LSSFADELATRGPLSLAESLGVKMRPIYFTDRQPTSAGDLFEWEVLARAVDCAERRFTMLELGAGFGRWTVFAAAALRRFRPGLRYRLVAAEAEPTHFRWLRQHTRDNGLHRWSRRGSCRLLRAAVSGRGGSQERFYIGEPATWYGQALVRPENAGADAATAIVPAVTLGRLLGRLGDVDLLDMDVQGVELEVLTQAAAQLRQIRHLFVETHSEDLHEAIRDLVGRTHELLVDVPPGASVQTPFGENTFAGGGVLTFRRS